MLAPAAAPRAAADGDRRAAPGHIVIPGHGQRLPPPRSQKFRLLQLLPSLAHVAVVTASWMLAQVTIATNFNV